MTNLVIVEDYNEFEQVIDAVNGNITFAIPILCDERSHPIINPISLLILRVDGKNSTFILPYAHNDALSIPIEWIYQLKPKAWITPSKKIFLHKFSHESPVIDYHGIEYMRNETTDFSIYMEKSTVDTIRTFNTVSNINKAVSIYEWVIYADKVIDHMMENGFSSINKWLDNEVIPTLHFIEKSGIHVKSDDFVKRFGEKTKKQISNNLVYSWYDPYTTTGRCSNSWAGINYASLNKSDGSRELFTSRFSNGSLLLVDFDAFHLRLIADIIGYKFPAGSVHEYLGKKYFQKDEKLTKEEYEESKRITFKYLYSNDRMKTPIDFFEKVYAYIDTFWENVLKTGYIDMMGRKLYLDDIEEPTPAKIFNYTVQLKETEIGIDRIKLLIPIFKLLYSKIILYTYDSILIDVHPNEDVIETTIKLLTDYGKWPVKAYTGLNYQSLKQIELENTKI